MKGAGGIVAEKNGNKTAHPASSLSSRSCERPVLPEIRLYDLRHTTATLLLQAGENPKIVPNAWAKRALL